MKKIFTLGLLALASTSFGQARNFQRTLVKSGKAIELEKSTALKTAGTGSQFMMPLGFTTGSPCNTSIGIYGGGSVGYLCGVDTFADKEIMMHYSLSDFSLGLPAKVDTVFGFFGFKVVKGNGNIRAKVYSTDITGAPVSLLGTSANVSVANVDTSGYLTAFIFPTPVSIMAKDFFVSIDISDLYATGDTVALYSTDNKCATTKVNDAWNKLSDDSYLAYSDPHSWNDTIDIAIFATVTAQQLSVPSAVVANLQAKVYPQPAQGMAYVGFTAAENGLVTIALKDITGKTILNSSLQTLKGNSYKVPMNVSNLSSGLYFAEIGSGVNKGMLKVVVGQ
ncbi:MAG: T9SS type A sorting domain-containing protein [Chitinophagaceae bacterium]